MYQHSYFQDRLVADRRHELERAADESRLRRGKPHWHRRTKMNGSDRARMAERPPGPAAPRRPPHYRVAP